MERNDTDRIVIKNKNSKMKIVLKVIIFLGLSITCGVISSKIIIHKEIENITANITKENKYNIDEVFSKAITDVSHSLVTISDSKDKLMINTFVEGNTTGIVVDKKGYIVTSFSKIKNMKNIIIKLPAIGKEPVEGKMVGADEDTDVALIKVNSDGLIPVSMCGKEIKKGKFVIAAGNAISNDFIGTTTLGIVTATNYNRLNSINDDSCEIIQTNAVINDENIGGPLFNLEGEVIGFNSQSLNFNKDEKLYYALSVDELKLVINYIISFTDKLGISGELIDDVQHKISGVYVENVSVDGYAAKAGLLPTDIILSIDNKTITSLEDINDIVKDKKSGESIKCVILRDGEKTNLEILFD